MFVVIMSKVLYLQLKVTLEQIKKLELFGYNWSCETNVLTGLAAAWIDSVPL